MIKISFSDFKRLVEEGNKRVYYFKSENILEMAFISEGIFIKSYVDLSTIDNLEEFFSQKMFVNAIRLLFRIWEPGDSGLPVGKNMEEFIKNNMAEETKNSDIQKDGVDNSGYNTG